MQLIKINNKVYQKKFDKLLYEHSHLITEENLTMIKVIILRYKELAKNEYYIILSLIYGLLFFKAIQIDDYKISDEDRGNIAKITKSYLADINGNPKTFLEEMMDYDEDLFSLKIIIKYTLLNSENKYLNYVPNKENYFKSIGYIIPLLTLKDSPFLLFYQDYYFKSIYPEEYVKVKNHHLKNTSKLELPGEYIMNAINSLSIVMKKAGVEGVLSLRKKSYFSLYGKYKRKETSSITDHIGIRLVFRNQTSLNKFKSHFESDFVFLKKKDYIKHPKENGYKAIHYSFIYPFRNSEILVELQIKTKQMDKTMYENLSHYNYTISEKKWDELFVEVHEGYRLMKQILEDRQQ